MALEAANYVSDLVTTNPLSSDPRSAGDDHIRMLKKVLKQSFPNVGGVVTATDEELSFVTGATSSLQAQINSINTSRAPLAIGVSTIFYMIGAPAGWTQDTNAALNHAIRISGGAGMGTGGSVPFTTCFAPRAITGVVDYHQLTVNEIPAHTHSTETFYSQGLDPAGAGFRVGAGNQAAATGSTGGSWGHNHPFIGTDLNMAVNYINFILCTRTT